MAEDAKAAKNRRLAEALRANLKRRKAAGASRAAAAEEEGSPEAAKPQDVAGGERGTD